MKICKPNDLISEYYEGLLTPVFLCGRRTIKWHNSAAQKLYKNETLRLHLTNIKKPKKEEMDVFTCNGLRYKMSIRPCYNGFYVEIVDIQNLSDLVVEPNNLLDGAEAIDNTIRKSSHKIFKSIAILNDIFEKIKRYDELKNLDAIADGTYRILRAANLYYEYNLLLQGNMHLENVDVFGEIEALCSSVKSIMRKSDIPFNCIVPKEKIICNLDMHKLSFALFHLICNSYYFTAKGNEITVTADCVDGDKLQIKVSDKGMGIDINNLTKVIEPFYSYDPSTGDISGCGLGLTYAYLFAEKSNGICTISSSKNQTVVSLSIPITPFVKKTGFDSKVVSYSVGKYDPMVLTMSTINSKSKL